MQCHLPAEERGEITLKDSRERGTPKLAKSTDEKQNRTNKKEWFHLRAQIAKRDRDNPNLKAKCSSFLMPITEKKPESKRKAEFYPKSPKNFLEKVAGFQILSRTLFCLDALFSSIRAATSLPFKSGGAVKPRRLLRR